MTRHKKYKNKRRQERAFTLVEILVAVAVFSIVVSVASGLFVWAIGIQRKSLAQQELLDQTSYAMEYMNRALRMAKKDITGNCVPSGENYLAPYGDSSIRFLSYESKCQEFYQSGNQLLERKSASDMFDASAPALPLISPSLQVARFLIGADNRGWSQTDNFQPKATLFLEINGRESANIKIQTTVSQRDLDVRY